MVYYNEWDPGAAAWLRKLIELGCIANGHVDERSIAEISPSDLKGYNQHHFFAGIGGWSYALRLSRWSDDIPVWTASLPCQPFSAAGKGLGVNDERHLLPSFLELVRQCKPFILFGEQVSSAIVHGWLDDLQTNMEAEGYAVGHCVLGAHSIGAPHIRQRLYWVANSISNSNQREISDRQNLISCDDDERMVFTQCEGSERFPRNGNNCDKSRRLYPDQSRSASKTSGTVIMGNSESERLREERKCRTRSEERECWHIEVDWIYCRDSKYRPIESGIKPLVNGVSRGMVHSSDPFNTQEARAVRLKGYGNAIVPQVAAEFIKAFMSCKS